jgi:hypothetical protein
VQTALGVVAGGVLNYIFARKGTRDLERVARQLAEKTDQVRRLVNTLAHALHAAGTIDPIFDPATGDLVSFTIRLDVHLPAPPSRPWWARLAWWRR